MKVFVVLPHSDSTLETIAADGWTLLDIGRGFVGRVLSPAYLASTASAAERREANLDASALRDLLHIKAADQLLRAPAPSVYTRLRAAGAALTGISGRTQVRLRLDDLELREGTTESSTDVRRAAAAPAPYLPEIEEAAERCRASDFVRIWIERDQQLPSAMAFARMLSSGTRFDLAGPFAQSHREALLRCPEFSGTESIGDPSRSKRQVAGLPGKLTPGSPLLWMEAPDEREPGDPRDGHAGRVPLASLSEPDILAGRGYRTAVVGFCCLAPEVLSAEGRLLNYDQLARGAGRLRERSVRTVAEWWIGAPGIDAPKLEKTLEVIERAFIFDRLAGLRLFHWPKNGLGHCWEGVPVELGDPPEKHDFARSLPFSAPGTVPSEEASTVLEEMARRLSERAPLNPGRVAEAYVHEPPMPQKSGVLVCLDPDCAIIELPRSLDGRSGRTWYATNLRTGAVLRIDRRLALLIENRRSPAEPGKVFTGLPARQVGKVCRKLCEKGILTEAQG